MSILLANIGNRDVLLNEEKIDQARERGKEILENFNDYQEKLRLPLLEPALDYIKKNHEEAVDEIHLFVTDQEEEEEYRSRDTIHFGRIIKRYLANNKCGLRTDVKLHVIRSDPNLYDSMFRFYQQELQKSIPQNPDRLFVLATGGIPAGNMALLFHSIAAFHNKVIPLYVNEKTGRAIKLTSTEQFIEHFQRTAVLNYLKYYNYSAIVSMELGNEKVNLLAKCARHRLAFDFQTGWEYLHLYLTREDQRSLSKVNLHLENLINKEDFRALIEELVINTRIKWRTGEYIDMLGRFFRLEEAILRIFVEEDLKIPTNKDKDKGFEGFKKGIEKIPELKKKLCETLIKNKPLEIAFPNRANLRVTIQYLEETSSNPEKYKRILDISTAINKLSDLRNNSIIAHGFQGISENDLKAIDIDNLLNKIVKLFDFQIEDISFVPINDVIKQAL